jgi:hypothetical protein
MIRPDSAPLWFGAKIKTYKRRAARAIQQRIVLFCDKMIGYSRSHPSNRSREYD